MKRSWWIVLSLLLVAALGVVVVPRFLSYYYQERGGQLLDQALHIEECNSEADPWLMLKPLTDPKARKLADEALLYFRWSVSAAPRHAQAHRWVGRTLLLLNAPGEAVKALSTYTRLRPDNPLGNWELGLAYARVAQQLDSATYWELDPSLDLTVGSSATFGEREMSLRLL